MILLDLVLVTGGYALSVFTWSKLRLWINGAEAEALNLKTRADALLATLRKA